MAKAETKDERTILDYLDESSWRDVLVYVPMQDVLRSQRVSKKWRQTILKYLRGVERQDALTILDYLNADSWRAVLANVPIQDILRSECVSHGWQKAVLMYLRVSKRIGSVYQKNMVKLTTNLLSPFITQLSPRNLLTPFYGTLQLRNQIEEDILTTRYRNENFKWLHRLWIDECLFVSDRCVSRFMSNNTLEELIICNNSRITGQCFVNKKSMNLKTLILDHSHRLQIRHLLSASDNLSQLKKLELSGVKDEIYTKIHLFIHKSPKLEHLYIKYGKADSEKFFKAVCSLSRLKHLHVGFETTDEDLEAVARSCQELQTLMFTACKAVTGRGLAAVSQHAPRLTSLGLWSSEHLTDQEVADCVRACPDLTSLDLVWCRQLTHKLLPLASGARRALNAQRPLRLRFGNSLIYNEMQYDKQLFVVADKPELLYENYTCEYPEPESDSGSESNSQSGSESASESAGES